jgi:hypothetical protein
MAQHPWAPWLAAWTGLAQEQPLSGDVSQWIRLFSPTVTVNGRGDPGLEMAIVRDVATYGAQLGPLSAVVLALADGAAAPEDALAKLRDICREIQDKKDVHRLGAAQRARSALRELADLDPAALSAVLTEFAAQPTVDAT